jgi:hypothetical protein
MDPVAFHHLPRCCAQVVRMDVKAILLIGTRPDDLDGSCALFGRVPLPAIDFLGRPVVQRIADRLFACGVSSVDLVGSAGRLPLDSLKPGMTGDVHTLEASDANLWRACESAFGDAAQSGAELVLVLRVGPYLEIPYDDLLQFHLDQRNRVTPVRSQDGASLHAFCISASRRNDAAFLFRHQLQESRTSCAPFVYRGYANPLRTGADLRRLTMDAFTGAAALPPVGHQARPGVWVGPGARIDRGARVLAPAYIGACAKIRPAAVVTRYSAVEHHCDVDCSTVVEDSNLMPFTYVGAGLDVAHALVGNHHLLHLHRNVEVEIADPRLLGTISPHAPLRLLSNAAALAAYLPRQILRGLFPSSQRKQPASLPAAVKAPSAALKSPAALQAAAQKNDSEFPTSFMVARRYGNE